MSKQVYQRVEDRRIQATQSSRRKVDMEVKADYARRITEIVLNPIQLKQEQKVVQ